MSATEKLKGTIGICRLFGVACEWAGRQGAESIKDLAGCWEGELDGHKVAINGHGEECKSSFGVSVPPYGLAILSPEGWPVAVCDAGGGAVMMGGDEQKLSAMFEAHGRA